MTKPKHSIVSFTAMCTLFVFSCSTPEQVKPVSPASISNPVKESSLNTITLTAAAAKRLGIETGTVADSNTVNARLYSGEIMAVPGQSITITAPVAGTLLSATGKNGPTAGQVISKGQPVYRLLILPSEKDLLSAREDIARQEVQYEVVKQKVDRNKKLLEEKAGSLRAVQEAEAEFAGVKATLNVARARLALLKGNGAAGLAHSLSTLDIQAPVSGTIQRIFSTPSQVVAAAAPIAEIAATNALWVRVPVYAGDAGKIDRQRDASIQLLSESDGTTHSVVAHPIQGPQTADPLNTSVDLYYEITNTDSRFRPGQRISTYIPLSGENKGLVIPYAAIAYDIHGNAWVYQQTDTLSFSRKRVQIDRVTGKNAVIGRGLTGGEKIVITGTAELFGTEFGGGK